MRLEELEIDVPGGGVALRLHPRLTVVAGIGAEGRAELVEHVVGALTGDGAPSTATVRSDDGVAVRVLSGGGRVIATVVDTGAATTPPLGWLAPDAATLRRRLVVGADDVGDRPAAPPRRREQEPPELRRALDALDELDAALAGAAGALEAEDARRARLAELDEALRLAVGSARRRHHAEAVATLSAARVEAAALADGPEADAEDDAVVESARRVAEAASAWADAAEALESRLAAPGARRPGESVADLARPVGGDEARADAAVPDHVPAGLDHLLHDLGRAESLLAELDARLQALTADRLGGHSHPAVARLVALDQATLWTAHARLAEARRAHRRERVALGALAPTDEGDTTGAELEDAHRRAEEAEARLGRNRRRVGALSGSAGVAAVPVALATGPIGAGLLVAAGVGAAVGIGRPWRDERRARQHEAVALERAGTPSYLAFHLRRVEATLDPGALHRYRLVEDEVAAAGKAWAELAADVDPDLAGDLEAEVRGHAATLAGDEAVDAEVAALRRTLDEEALPARDEAVAALADVLAPYGLDPSVAGPEDGAGVLHRAVAARVDDGQRARHRQRVAAAALEADRCARALDDLLAGAGVPAGLVADRVRALDEAARAAAARTAARHRARPRAEVEADLARLEVHVRASAAALGPDELPAEGEVADVPALQAERDRLVAVATSAPATDPKRLRDRRDAVARRVAALRHQHGEPDEGRDVGAVAEGLGTLLDGAAGDEERGRDAVPLLLDGTLDGVPSHRVWEVLDALLAHEPSTQLVLLSDDPFVAAWARARVDTGELSLLEPAPEPVD